MEENKPAIPSELSAPIREMDLLIGKTFNSLAGRKVLAWMRKEYIEKINAGYVVDAKGNINALASILDNYQREGKRAMVLNLEMRMQRANK